MPIWAVYAADYLDILDGVKAPSDICDDFGGLSRGACLTEIESDALYAVGIYHVGIVS